MNIEQRNDEHQQYGPATIYRKYDADGFQLPFAYVSPTDIDYLPEQTMSKHQVFLNAHKEMTTLANIMLEEALKSPANAVKCVSLIKAQEKLFENYFLIQLTERIIKILNDFHSNDNDCLRTQADSIGILIGEMFNQNLLTWQNIEGHLQRLMARGYVSQGSLSIFSIIFHTCDDTLKKTMPAGCFNSLYSTYEENCRKISGCKTLNRNKLTQSHVEKGNQFTYADFKRIVIQENHTFQNVMKHLNSADFNAHVNKYINLIVNEALKKPTLSEAYAKILSEMRFILKKENLMELNLKELFQNKLLKYLTISDRNLKEERQMLQLQSQSFGNIFGELHKVDLIKCSTIESFFEQLLDKDYTINEGSLCLICDIIQSCGSELKITLGTNKFNNYVKQLKRKTNPFNMSKLICNKVNSIKSISVNQTSASTLKVVNNQNSNELMVQPSTSQSKPTVATSQLSNKDELLNKLKALQEL